ncbi:alcohol dehydrogenase catalytic domain-containing protein [Phytoactinopolyspora halotolerans]|uniref:Alcohol dehydrogenase n=1 Tax=Phytoactinopolyspora halotolerans TaxID=1981512 RepID=A0A6L9S752_9ACTN|nr:alcohol dehydrogenase catalytic domain-containing protein [Phytoactinopolyspora halotolerans]NEE00807.1 alcohol dehydrogenase catalytic domain-containing protein [Phytoactinopolyspora halotolerans]
MSSVRFAQVGETGGPFRIVTGEIDKPGHGHVRLTVEAVGVCHTDYYFINGGFPVEWPAVFGHEIAGRIDALGEGVEGWNIGDRVAVGWFGGNCGGCDACREGDFIHCAQVKTPGWQYAGGYADVTIVPTNALARIPESLTSVEAAPMGCAGVATFNSLRRSGARPGDLVAVLGIGGLGHLGVQFANKMGFETVAIARGEEKAELATGLGAHHYINSNGGDVAARLQALGGAQVVLATAMSSAAMTAAIDGLRHNGELLVVGATPEPIEVSPFQILSTSKGLHGHPSGTAKDVEDTLRFATLAGVRPMTETYSLDQISAGYERMLSGDARFRVVLTTGN